MKIHAAHKRTTDEQTHSVSLPAEPNESQQVNSLTLTVDAGPVAYNRWYGSLMTNSAVGSGDRSRPAVALSA
jgi:hypothetical protein